MLGARRPQMARTWFGEIGSCCCLPFLPKLACVILATTCEPFAGAQYFSAYYVAGFLVLSNRFGLRCHDHGR